MKRIKAFVHLCIVAALMSGYAFGEDKKPDYTSKVPQFTFADTLVKQQEQLEKNPLILRFAESRKKLITDPYHPNYHFVSPETGMNDTNGLCFWKGRWHLFYQAYPPEDQRQHWGHAVSDDLVHWKDLPIAIYPNPEDRCFSGGTVVEDDRVIAMYHGTQLGNMVAVSTDPLLLNWEKLTGDAVIPFGPGYHVYDPCIWKQDGTYYSLSGLSGEGPNNTRVRAEDLWRSKDLTNWERLGEFVENGAYYGMLGDDGACPYFWPIGDQHILLYFSHMSGGQYLLGDYDTKREKFIPTSHSYFNFGRSYPAGVHAPSAAPDGKDGVIVIFNMNAGKHTVGWGQIASLPRRLSLIERDFLRIEPAGDLESLRYDHQHIDRMELPANKEIVFENISGNAMEIVAEIDPKKSPMIEMNILRSPDKEEYTRINYYRDSGYIIRPRHPEKVDPKTGKPTPTKRHSWVTLDTTHASILGEYAFLRAPETAPLRYEEGETLNLRIFIDKSVVEVFINGKQCLAMRVYPGRKDSLGVSLLAQGTNAELKSLDAWQMKSIYE